MLEIKEVELSKLKLWEDNPRINDHAVDAIAKSIETFGFNVPILYDQNFTIIAGHARWKAAKKLGLTHVPAIMLNLTEDQKKAFAIADNKLGSLANWDNKLLKEILKELSLKKFDIKTLGYSEAEKDAYLIKYSNFDWDELSKTFTEEQKNIFAMIAVRIPFHLKEKVIATIRQYASDNNILGNDTPDLTGRVICALLGIKQ